MFCGNYLQKIDIYTYLSICDKYLYNKTMETKTNNTKIMEKKERKQERRLLIKIQDLSKDLICIIYEYMTGNAKFICNHKYTFLETHIKKDSKKGFKFWKTLQNVFEPIEKEKLFDYLCNIIVPSHESIIDRIWYNSKVNNDYYTGMDLLLLWKNDNLDVNYYGPNRKAIHNHIKSRIIDAIYYYILRHIENYESHKKICLNHLYYYNSTILDYSNIFKDTDKIHRLCKSLFMLHISTSATL